MCGIEPLLDGSCCTLSVSLEHSLLSVGIHLSPYAYCTHVNKYTSFVDSHQFSETPLDGASQYGHLHTVRLLLQRGAKVDSRDRVRQS